MLQTIDMLRAGRPGSGKYPMFRSARNTVLAKKIRLVSFVSFVKTLCVFCGIANSATKRGRESWSYLLIIEGQQDLRDPRFYLTAKYTRFGKHHAGCLGGIGVFVFVGKVNDFGYARLYDGFGTFVTGKQGGVDLAAAEVHPDVIEDGIELGMADERIFCLQEIALLLPGKFIIVAAPGQAIVSCSHDLIFIIHDTGPHLGIGIFAAMGR